MINQENKASVTTGQELATIDDSNQELELAPTDIIAQTGANEIRSLLNKDRDFAWGNIPIHVQMLQQIEDPDIREAVGNAYEGLKPQSFKDFVNRRLMVLGMRMYEHGPFKSFSTGEMQPGYYQLQILVEHPEEEGKLLLLKSGSQGLAFHALNILSNPRRGWYLFPEPVEYLFSTDEKNRHYMLNTAKDMMAKLRRHQKEVEKGKK